MMPPLPELQTTLASAIVSGRLDEASEAIVDDAPGAAARLQIYHNHYRVTLIEALEATFPVMRRLVGCAFFQQMTRRFVMSHPPGGPCLFEYGRDLPTFVADLKETEALPYLSDVARLEWALNEAYFAADAPILDAGALAGLAPERLVELILPLHPSCRLISSPYPIDLIWKANQDDETAETVDLASGGAQLLVHRGPDDAGWIKLDAAGFAFVDALAAGRSIREAAGAAFAQNNTFDLAALLALIVDAGVISPHSLPNSQA